MSAASFISMAGTLSVQGFSGLCLRHGLDRHTCSSPSFLDRTCGSSAPTRFRTSSARRYGGNAARLVGSFGDPLFVHLSHRPGDRCRADVSRFIGLDFNVGVFVGLIWRPVLLRCSAACARSPGRRSRSTSSSSPATSCRWSCSPGSCSRTRAAARLRQGAAVEQPVGARHHARDPQEKATREIWKAEAAAAEAKMADRRRRRKRSSS